MKGASSIALSEPMRASYVLKRYPRYSETFVVREVFAHEEAGLEKGESRETNPVRLSNP